MYINKYDYDKSCAKTGVEAEDLFYKCLLKFGNGKVRKANRNEQFNHIDFILDEEVKFEIKARKKINRSDENKTDELIWLEWTNVNGKDGWLLGDSDKIVFEREDDFLIVNREKLKGMAEKKCDMNFLVDNAKEALYKVYQRKGRRDLISLIKMSDLEEIPHEIWPKI